MVNSCSRRALVSWLLGGCMMVLMLVACGGGNDYTPKPAAYLRIALPEKNYVQYDTTGLPFSFEYAKDAQIVWKKNTARDKWIDINYPSLNGVIFLSYKNINGANDMKGQIDTSYQLLKLHFDYASGMDENQFYAPGRHVSATTYSIKGQNVASTYQFWATDSVSHFLRGSLYLNCKPNNDSLAPLIDYLQQDVNHLLETLEWK